MNGLSPPAEAAYAPMWGGAVCRPASRFTTVRGVPVFSREWLRVRKDPPVVLVHGLGVSSKALAPLGDALSDDFRVHALDLPGFGQSGRPERAGGVRALAEDLVAWMEARGLGPSLLVANSLGCHVIVEAARLRPDLVERIVLAGPALDPSRPSLLEQAVSWLRDLPREPLRLLVEETPDVLRADLASSVAFLREARRMDLLASLRLVEVPALVVRLGNDPLASDEWLAALAVASPTARLAVVPGASHGAPYSAPLELRDAILPFLREARLEREAVSV